VSSFAEGGYRGTYMDTPAGYLHWGFILISIPNLLVIGLMIALFALALFVPLPGEKEKS
jgi:hypothetical protein